MENTTKIAFSAVTHIGTTCTVNDDRIYANGKFLHPSVADYAQISLEVNDGKCLFALSDGMEDRDSGISLINDLRKFHQKAHNSSKDIHVKLDELVQCVEQSSNLLHSISLGDNDFRERKTAFAGILIDEGSIAAVNLGSCRIYKLEGDTFKLVVNDFKRAERLMKMGIISNEQAEMLSGQQKASMEEGRTTVKKSNIDTLKEGTIYLICSSGLTDAVNEDSIYDMLASNRYPDEAVSQLVEEAIKNEGEDNITAIVIKIEGTGEVQTQLPGPRTTQLRSAKSGKMPARLGSLPKSARRRSIGISRLVSMVVLVVVAAAVLFGGFKLWTKLRNPEVKDVSSQEGTPVTAVEGSTSSSGISGGSGGTDEITQPEGDAAVTDGAIGAETGDNTASGGSGTDLVGPEGTTYVVKAGDMLMKISKKFYGDENKYRLIMDANDITDPNKIAVGDTLKIPPLK